MESDNSIFATAIYFVFHKKVLLMHTELFVRCIMKIVQTCKLI